MPVLDSLEKCGENNYQMVLVKDLAISLRLTGASRWLSGKESTLQCRRPSRWGFNPWVGKILLWRQWQPITMFWSGKSHGKGSLAGYSPWGHKEWATTEWACTCAHSNWQRLWSACPLNWYSQVSWIHIINSKPVHCLSHSQQKSENSLSTASCQCPWLSFRNGVCLHSAVVLSSLHDLFWMDSIFISLRPVFKVVDNKGGGGNKRGISPHTWANWGEKEPDEAIPGNKEMIRTHPSLKKELW